MIAQSPPARPAPSRGHVNSRVVFECELADSREASLEGVVTYWAWVSVGTDTVLADDVGNTKSGSHFDELDLAKGEWNGSVGLRPATIVAFRLMVARGERAYEAGIPVAGIIAAMCDDLVSRTDRIRGVAKDVVD